MKKVKLGKLDTKPGLPFKIEGEIVELPIEPERDVRYLFLIKNVNSYRVEEFERVGKVIKEVLGEAYDKKILIASDDLEIYELFDEV